MPLSLGGQPALLVGCPGHLFMFNKHTMLVACAWDCCDVYVFNPQRNPRKRVAFISAIFYLEKLRHTEVKITC